VWAKVGLAETVIEHPSGRTRVDFRFFESWHDLCPVFLAHSLPFFLASTLLTAEPVLNHRQTQATGEAESLEVVVGLIEQGRGLHPDRMVVVGPLAARRIEREGDPAITDEHRHPFSVLLPHELEECNDRIAVPPAGWGGDGARLANRGHLATPHLCALTALFGTRRRR